MITQEFRGAVGTFSGHAAGHPDRLQQGLHVRHAAEVSEPAVLPQPDAVGVAADLVRGDHPDRDALIGAARPRARMIGGSRAGLLASMTAHARRPRRLSRAQRHARRAPARVGPLAGARRGVRDAGPPGRLRPARHADLRARRGRAEARLDHRRRAQGDVRLRRQGRPATRVARRRHRVGRAGVRAAPARRRRGRSGTSRRTSATSDRRRAGTASTGRSASRCSVSTTRPSTSRSSRSRTASTGRSRAAPAPVARQLDGRRRDPGALPRGAARLLARARGAARRRDRPRRGESAAHPRLEARRLAGR